MARQCIFGSSLRFIINCLLVNILSCTIVLIQSYHISIDNNQLSINSSEENKQLLPTINNYTTANNNETIIKETPEWWIEERSEFYKITRFDLSEENIRILGGKFAQNKTGHLPFWFNFHLFKTVFNKKYRDYDEELLAHTRYVNNCTRILRQRVLRAILAGTVMPKIDEHGDLGDDKEVENPLLVAIEYVKNLVSKSQSKNQIRNYLFALEERDGSALDGKLPY